MQQLEENNTCVAVSIFFADKCKRNAQMKLAPYTRAYLLSFSRYSKTSFQPRVHVVEKRTELSSASRLKALSPFLDENNQLTARGHLP